MGEAVQAALAARFPDVEPDEALDVHHYYAAVEEHLDECVVVHRKGAVRAVGTVVIPGSMGSASYVGVGLESSDSFESCSHGAGRAMGRRAAKRAIAVQQVMDDLGERDVYLAKAKKHDVAEEAPSAYKDIENVMDWQRDLVEPTIRLTPLGVLKG
jgi:tRNA-splicing ligase RtcB